MRASCQEKEKQAQMQDKRDNSKTQRPDKCDNDIDIVDLTSEDPTDQVGEPVSAAASESCETSAPKRRRVGTVSENNAPLASSHSSHNQAKTIEYLSLPGGVLDDTILACVDAIAQQLNW